MFILHFVEFANSLSKIMILHIGIVDFDSLHKVKDVRRRIHTDLIPCLLKNRRDFYSCWSFAIGSCDMNWLEWFVRVIEDIH